MSTQWFKFYGGEYLSDPKIERLSPLERSCWVTLLCLASMNGQGKIEFLTVETLLNKSGIQFDPYHPEEWEKALSVLQKFSSMKMIDASKEGVIQVINWEKRQESFLTDAERAKKYRDNRKSSQIRHEPSDERHARIEQRDESRGEENRVNTIASDDAQDSEVIPSDEDGNPIKPKAQKKVSKYLAPFDFRYELERLNNSEFRPNNIIAFYFEDRGWRCDNYAVWVAACKRHMPAAKRLVGFNDGQLIKGAKLAKEATPDYTLETILKVLTK